MSSRALRKLQREKEEKERVQNLEQEEEDNDSDVDEQIPSKSTVLNAFDMLNATNEEEGEDADPDKDQDSESDKNEPQEKQAMTPKSKRSKKKKKGKGKGKAGDQYTDSAKPQRLQDREEGHAEEDEIDLALKALKIEGKQDTATAGPTIAEADAQLHRLLAVEAKHLNALDEMKRLFGNVVLEQNEEDSNSQRRRGRGPQTVDLGGALTARRSPVSKGQGLKGLLLKRNPLIKGKEEWPQCTSGGLSMEMVEKMDDGTVEYRFTHNSIYQGVQKEFESCVASMDPQRLITMLIFNPYHISTLLQVSEIAKQQGDHSVSSDLIERTLFTFGRSVHSSFTHALSEGRARLDFRRPENREFWLAGWRYIKDLGQRGTWRTAYEWAKLILSLDPESDPYCISKIIDQLAIRGGQSEHFLKLAQTPFFKDDIWMNMPNITISTAMAQYRLKQAQVCRATLSRTVQEYPWVFARLFQELNLSHLPKSIWGKQPRTDRETFDTESYVINAKDIWSLPDAVSLLVEVAETTDAAQNPRAPSDTPISLDEVRSTLLTGSAPLINLLPRDMTTRPSRSSDPHPPEDDLPSYDPTLPSMSPSADAELEAAYADLPPDRAPDNDSNTDFAAPQEPTTLMSFLSRIIPGLVRAAGSDNHASRATQGAGVDPTELSARHARFEEMTERLNELPDERPLGAERADPAEVAREREELEQVAQRILQAHMGAEGFDYGHRSPGDHPPSDEPSDQPPSSDDETELQFARHDAALATNTANEGATQDDQGRLQHWLAGSGVQALKAYLDTHANDTARWSAPEGERLLGEYASKLSQLRNTRMRDFILRYALPQGTNADVKGMVEGRIGR